MNDPDALHNQRYGDQASNEDLDEMYRQRDTKPVDPEGAQDTRGALAGCAREPDLPEEIERRRAEDAMNPEGDDDRAHDAEENARTEAEWQRLEQERRQRQNPELTGETSLTDEDIRRVQNTRDEDLYSLFPPPDDLERALPWARPARWTGTCRPTIRTDQEKLDERAGRVGPNPPHAGRGRDQAEAATRDLIGNSSTRLTPAIRSRLTARIGRTRSSRGTSRPPTRRAGRSSAGLTTWLRTRRTDSTPGRSGRNRRVVTSHPSNCLRSRLPIGWTPCRRRCRRAGTRARGYELPLSGGHRTPLPELPGGGHKPPIRLPGLGLPGISLGAGQDDGEDIFARLRAAA